MNPKVLPAIAAVVMLAIGAAYMVFLVGSWSTLQAEHSYREQKINSLLDRIPPMPSPEPNPSPEP